MCWELRISECGLVTGMWIAALEYMCGKKSQKMTFSPSNLCSWILILTFSCNKSYYTYCTSYNSLSKLENLTTFGGKIKEIKFPKDRNLVSISYDSHIIFIVLNHLYTSDVFWEFKCDTKQKKIISSVNEIS